MQCNSNSNWKNIRHFKQLFSPFLTTVKMVYHVEIKKIVSFLRTKHYPDETQAFVSKPIVFQTWNESKDYLCCKLDLDNDKIFSS